MSKVNHVVTKQNAKCRKQMGKKVKQNLPVDYVTWRAYHVCLQLQLEIPNKHSYENEIGEAASWILSRYEMGLLLIPNKTQC